MVMLGTCCTVILLGSELGWYGHAQGGTASTSPFPAPGTGKTSGLISTVLVVRLIISSTGNSSDTMKADLRRFDGTCFYSGFIYANLLQCLIKMFFCAQTYTENTRSSKYDNM